MSFVPQRGGGMIRVQLCPGWWMLAAVTRPRWLLAEKKWFSLKWRPSERCHSMRSLMDSHVGKDEWATSSEAQVGIPEQTLSKPYELVTTPWKGRSLLCLSPDCFPEVRSLLWASQWLLSLLLLIVVKLLLWAAQYLWCGCQEYVCLNPDLTLEGKGLIFCSDVKTLWWQTGRACLSDTDIVTWILLTMG